MGTQKHIFSVKTLKENVHNVVHSVLHSMFPLLSPADSELKCTW